jgi:hypothetical protein
MDYFILHKSHLFLQFFINKSSVFTSLTDFQRSYISTISVVLFKQFLSSTLARYMEYTLLTSLPAGLFTGLASLKYM